jgi:uncharacterized metal-binding protein
MFDLPEKVGIVACSGEELAEGTITRLAALKVLEQMRPGQTVTICLPLFLAGGEGDRAFARFHPTIALDGCDKRCAALGTERYSAKPVASIVVGDVINDGITAVINGVIGDPDQVDLGRARRLSPAGLKAVDAVAERVTQTVDALLGARGEHTSGLASESLEAAPEPAKVATCSCGSGIPIQQVDVDGQPVILVALHLLFARSRDAGKLPGVGTTAELMSAVKIYNPVPEAQEAAYTRAIAREYAAFYARAR